ncbi:MAG: carboxypeptidase regulatory-like domain-containing protein [Candidatus Sumerlaeia bacterium]
MMAIVQSLRAAIPAAGGWTLLAGKLTLLLALGWLLHAALGRANPRWRVLLWRLIAVGSILLPLSIWTPAIEFTLDPPPAASAMRAAPVVPVHAPSAPAMERPARASAPRPAPPVSPAARPGIAPAPVVAGAAPHARPSLWRIALGLWCLGALFLLLRGAIGMRGLARIIGQSAPAPEPLRLLADQIARDLGCRGVGLRLSGRVSMPFISGWRRPVLLLPGRMSGESYRDELPAILAHEFSHVRSGDIFWSRLLALVGGVLWPHPLAWAMGRAHASACEEVSDAVSAAYIGDAGDYSRTLARVAVELAELPPPVGGIAMARVPEVMRRLACLRRRVFADPLSRSRIAMFASVLMVVAATLGGLRFAYAKAEPGQKGATPATSKQDVPLARFPGKMRLTVLDHDGKPLAGATIMMRYKSPKDEPTSPPVTDKNGICLFKLPDKKPEFLMITASAPGRVSMRASWDSYPEPRPIPAEFTIQLEKGTTIGGTVINEDGRPVAGVEVSLLLVSDSSRTNVRPALTGQPFVTDAQGRWRCDRMPARFNTVWVRAAHRDYERVPEHTMNMTPPPVDKLRDMTSVMTIQRGVSVEGIVLGKDGKPLPGATVSFNVAETTTTKDGRFGMDRLKVERTPLVVSAKGCASNFSYIEVAKGMKPIEIRLQPAKPLHGRVVDVAGKPLEGAYVSLDSINNQSFRRSWAEKTDKDGRFTWEGAPAGKLKGSVWLKGYANNFLDCNLVPGEDNVITMNKPVVITGMVTDAATSRPIESFKVCPILYWRGGGSLIERGHAVTGKAGVYHISLDRTDIGHGVRIEADGYRPAISPRYEVGRDEDVVFDARLEPAAMLKGEVRLPDGAPASQAQVLLATASQDVQIDGGLVERAENSVIRTADSAGRFELPAQIEPYTIVALGDTGYAEVSQAEFEKNPSIRLQPWSRIEGRLMQAGRPLANEVVRLSFMQTNPTGSPRKGYRARTGNDGRYELLRVPPGPVSIQPDLSIWEESPMTSIESVPIVAEPGKTQTVNFGEGGREVTGRLAAVNGKSDVDWHWGIGYLVNRKVSAATPKVAAFGFDVSRGWNEAWISSREGRAFMDTLDHHFVKLSKDGSFRIHGVRPGDYILAFRVYEPPVGGGCLVTPLTNKTIDVKVGEGSATLDLGSVPVELNTPAAKNDRAPDFEFQTLSGAKKSLKDYRGRVVLLDFWATWCGACVDGLPDIKALDDAYKTKGLTVVSLSLDREPAAPRRLVEKNGYGWEQGFLGDWTRTKVPADYGITFIPTMVLIGRDGRILASTSSIEELKNTLAQALGKR